MSAVKNMMNTKSGILWSATEDGKVTSLIYISYTHDYIPKYQLHFEQSLNVFNLQETFQKYAYRSRMSGFLVVT